MRIQKLLYHVPDISFTRRMASTLRIKIANKYILPDDIIQKAEESPSQKERIVSDLIIKRKKTAKQLDRDIINVIAKTPEYASRKDTRDIEIDIRFCFFAYGFLPNEYYAFGLEEKTYEERSNFISEMQRIIYRCYMNDILKADIFLNKWKTYKEYGEYFDREMISVKKASDYSKYQSFIKAHPMFVKKDVYGSEGKGISFVDTRSKDFNKKVLFDEMIRGGEYVLEERIIQSKELAAFNHSSVNTVRVITFLTKSGVVVPYCTLRTGKLGAFVDNGASGGVQACIDYETGIVETDGYDEMGGIYQTHPSSNTIFKGYQMPDWNKLRLLVQKISVFDKRFKFIGWDFAHTEDGWLLVEGNETPRLIARQMIKNVGLKSTFEDIMNNMDLIL